MQISTAHEKKVLTFPLVMVNSGFPFDRRLPSPYWHLHLFRWAYPRSPLHHISDCFVSTIHPESPGPSWNTGPNVGRINAKCSFDGVRLTLASLGPSFASYKMVF